MYAEEEDRSDGASVWGDHEHMLKTSPGEINVFRGRNRSVCSGCGCGWMYIDIFVNVNKYPKSLRWVEYICGCMSEGVVDEVDPFSCTVNLKVPHAQLTETVNQLMGGHLLKRRDQARMWDVINRFYTEANKVSFTTERDGQII